MDRLVSFDKQLQIKLSIIRLFISMWSFDKDCLSVLIEEIKKVFKIIFMDLYVCILKETPSIACSRQVLAFTTGCEPNDKKLFNIQHFYIKK
jgi:hypothetical protein